MDEPGTHGADELTLEPVTVVRTRRPRALWAVLAAVGLAAGALVVTSAGDDGTQRPGLPVAFGSGAGERDEGAATADSMLAWITYVAGDGLPTLGGEAPAYRLQGDVDEARVRALADALGVAGDIVHEGQGWKVSDGDATLEVYEGGGAQWWYSAAGGDVAVGSGSSGGSTGGTTGGSTDGVACDPGADCVEPTLPCPPDTRCIDPVPPEPQEIECTKDDGCAEPAPLPVEPAPAADLPSEEEATSIALDLLATTGMDTDDAAVTVEGPYDAWYVAVEPRVDGVPSGLAASVAVGSEGKVTTASGYLATPERLGDYPLLDTRAVIDRANAQTADAPLGRGREVGTASDVDTGGTTGSAPDVGTATPAVGDDPCAPPEGASDGCGGTTGGTVEPDTTLMPRCKVQADGSEICETEPGITCPQAAPPADESVTAPASLECTPPPPDPGVEPPPVPEPVPTPVEIVLVDAEPALVQLTAIDGSTDAYLVPGYRFTDADGGRVDLPAVADEALTTPQTTETTVPETPVLPDPGGKPPVEPQPCGAPIVEEDSSGTTHTVQPHPDCVDPELAIGVEYNVDVDTECAGGSFSLGQHVWITDNPEVAGWADPGERHEGGMFTLDTPDTGTFVGDADGDTVAEFYAVGPAEDIFCTPEPRP